MKPIEEYVRSIPDFPEGGNYFQRCNKYFRRCRGIASGSRFDSGEDRRH